MALIVLKFGGSSLAGARLFAAAEKIAAARLAGDDVIAVLSARGNTTDRLLEEARTLCADPPPRELDLLLSTGEQVSAAHMAMALSGRGCPAVALTGWQAGIRTDGCFGNAQVHHVTGNRIRRALAAGNAVLVTGFQGISEEGDITTLGRGGSDTTAVALAAFLQADACKIYTDVDGVYTADPHELPEAHKLSAVSYADMLEMAEQGARVLHSRCVSLAQTHGLTFEVCSAFEPLPGTRITAEEARRFCGVAIRRGIRLPRQTQPAAAVSLIGAGCAEEETAIQVLRAMAKLTLLQIARRERSITVYVPETEAVDAARALHYLYLS